MTTEERQRLIKEASQKYYSNGTSPLTDAEFDKLLEEERAENPDSPLLGIGHGYDISLTSGQKFEHKYGTVGSLPKCHSWDEFPKYLRDTKICATLKLDGLSCAMYYRNGMMYRALTRGDGQVGIDITDKILKIVPEYATITDKNFTGAVRGEILMPLDKFEEYSKINSDAKNPRNTTAGLINAKEVSDDLKYLTVVVYTVIGLETKSSPFTDYESMHQWLADNFSNVVMMKSDTYSRESEFMEYMSELRDSWYDKYPADGIVLTANAVLFQLSNTGIYLSYTASAFKFKAESAETTIIGIEWNLSKTKYLIPTLLVEPVTLSGATVRRCAGCNAKMVKDNGWGQYARVIMTRSGEVIPNIEETIVSSIPELPQACPSCGAKLVWDGVHLKCPNLDCLDMQIQDLLVWCNNIAPVDGLGDTLKLKFFTELHDLYEMEMSIEGVYNFNIALPQTDMVQKQLFYQMVNKMKFDKVPLISALKALNVPRLGDATADLLSHYPDDVLRLMYGDTPDNLAFKVGNANADSIIKHIDKFKRLQFIKDHIQFTTPEETGDKIKVAITGSLSIPRKQFEKILNDNGFILGDITKDTKYLITDNPNSGSSKNAKADKLGVEKITETEFSTKYNLVY